MVSVAAVGSALTVHSSPMLHWYGNPQRAAVTGCSAGNTITTVSLTRPPWNPPQNKTPNMTVTQNEIEIMMMMMILGVSKLCTNHINHAKCKLYKRVFSNTSNSCANSMQQYLPLVLLPGAVTEHDGDALLPTSMDVTAASQVPPLLPSAFTRVPPLLPSMM
jgi:hypothetical protein